MSERNRNIRYLQALTEALHQVMAEDPTTFILGEDVRHSLRGMSKGLLAAFGPDRVLDTPASEAAFTGFATGAAMAGMRPIVEFQINPLIHVAFDQLINQALKIPYMTGGAAKVPVTYVFPASGYRAGLGSQHSDHTYPYLVHSGMKTIIPATPYDAKGLLVAAIRCDDPVAIYAPATLLAMRGEVPAELYEIPLGRGDIKREGTDITVVAVGPLVPEALKAAEVLAGEGISLHVFDPRTLYPLDLDGLEKAVRKTGRVIVFDDSNRTCGYGAEIAAEVGERWFGDLRAPVVRIGRATLPIPFSPAIDKVLLPSADVLVEQARKLMRMPGRGAAAGASQLDLAQA